MCLHCSSARSPNEWTSSLVKRNAKEHISKTGLLDSVYFLINLRKINAASREVAGLNPDEVTGFFNLPNPSRRTMAVGFIQPLKEINIRRYFWEYSTVGA
jgi:hypothetical protein